MTNPVTVARIRVDRILFHPLNIRRDLGDLRDLTASIKQFGVMQPIVVEQHGQQMRLRAGHRRTAAARLAGVSTIPAVIHAQTLDDDEFIMQALHENTMRRGLEPDERRAAIRQLLDLGCSKVGIATSLNVSVNTITTWAADPERKKNRGRGRRVNVGNLRTVVEQWRDAAELGLTADQARDLIDQLDALTREPICGLEKAA